MRRDVSHQQKTDRADDTLRALVRLLARAAAHEALEVTPQAEEAHQASSAKKGDNHVK